LLVREGFYSLYPYDEKNYCWGMAFNWKCYDEKGRLSYMEYIDRDRFNGSDAVKLEFESVFILIYRK